MNVVKTIICELTAYKPGAVDVSQGDRGSRAVSCRLMNAGEPWMIPEGATARVAYTLPDGTEGLYDRRPDGTPMWEIAGNAVTVELADQIMAQAGMVQMSILIIGPEGGQLATWPIRVNVSANKAARLTVPEAMPPYGAAFEGKLFYGGPDGAVSPLALGAGLEVRDGVLRLKVAGDEDSGQNVNGLSAEASALLITILRNATYPEGNDQSANITALEEALASGSAGGEEEPDAPVEPDEPDVALSSISAAYNGGDVPVGTAVTDLTGIVVTAHYSDGSTETVTGYTLSGTIAEGSNTVTVSYQGKTATFSVTGVADSGGDESHEGVSSINWFIATNDPNNGTIDSTGLREPDNGYVVTTDTAHTALNAKRNVLAFPLISGKTYSIQVSNADAANQQFFGLWVSTLNIEPVKGEVTAVTDTIIRNIVAWGVVPANGHSDYTYTAGDGEYLMINANAGNILTITAEVTA